uniref:NTF2-related export protein n=1 Tax=Megaselia scalaris TaxID=36166 RepID=T1GN95_MEGSC
MNSDPAVKKLFEECNRTAQKFTSLYYQAFDKRRHDLGAMYLDNGLLVWNGNGASGRDQIQSAVLQLPTTNHRLNTLDAQPIIDETTVGQATFCITCGGTVKYNGHEDFLHNCVGEIRRSIALKVVKTLFQHRWEPYISYIIK